MEYLGTKVGTGLGIGKVVIIEDDSFDDIDEALVGSVTDEVIKVTRAIDEVISDYDKSSRDSLEKDIQDLCKFYKMLLSSSSLIGELTTAMEKNNVNSVGAVKIVFKAKEKQLSELDNIYLRERSKDVYDVSLKLLRKLLGIEEFSLDNIKEDSVIVGREISPSLLLSGNLTHVKGIVADIGGKTSHVGILSTSLGIPSVFGVKNISSILKTGEEVFVDGNQGRIVTDLSDEEKIEIGKKIDNENKLKAEYDSMIGKKAITTDGKEFEVCVNTGDLTELEKIKKVGADGIGLFRTEFLFLNKTTPPTEEYLFSVYKSFVEANGKKPMIIRTLDIGGDKKCSYIDIDNEENPFLGYRAIRYCLDNKEFFKVSLRAILRAGFYGDVRIMYPMISSLDEVVEANAILDEVKEELSREKIDFDSNIKVGVMIEVPSVAMMIQDILNYVDFVSIGTNDLVQYSLAVDRGNQSVSKLYSYFNPGVLRIINKVISTDRDKTKMIGMCGEMAADALGIILLVGMGLDEFSVNISAASKVKKMISLLNYQECVEITKKILDLSFEKDIKVVLEEYARGVYGKYY